jgi:hypothetical protein
MKKSRHVKKNLSILGKSLGNLWKELNKSLKKPRHPRKEPK